MNARLRFVAVTGLWGGVCGLVHMPTWLAIVGGVTLGVWFSPYWQRGIK